VGQGALALECRSERADIIAMLAPLIHLPSLLAITAERAFSRALSGSCRTPLAGYAAFEDGRLRLRGLLASRDGSDVIRGEQSAPIEPVAASLGAADALGRELADTFLAQGASRFLAA
jgi:hydroxymethylbilane synthase